MRPRNDTSKSRQTPDLSSIDGGLDLNWNQLGLGGTGTPAIVRRATQLIPGNLLSGVALPSAARRARSGSRPG